MKTKPQSTAPDSVAEQEMLGQLGIQKKPDFSKFKLDFTDKDLQKTLSDAFKIKALGLGYSLRPVATFTPAQPRLNDACYLYFATPVFVQCGARTPGYQEGFAGFRSDHRGTYLGSTTPMLPSVQLSYPIVPRFPFAFGWGYVIRFYITLSEDKIYSFKATKGSVPGSTQDIRFHNAPVSTVISFDINPNESVYTVAIEQQNAAADKALWTFWKAVVYEKVLVNRY